MAKCRDRATCREVSLTSLCAIIVSACSANRAVPPASPAMPCYGCILSRFGDKTGASGDCCRRQLHRGIDVGATDGADVVAVADGIVVGAAYSKLSGGEITLYHERYGLWTRYVHVKNMSIFDGKRVSRGDVIGQVGLFPNSDGVPHVHLEVCNDKLCEPNPRVTGVLDPLPFVVKCNGMLPSDDVAKPVLLMPVRCSYARSTEFF